MVSSRIGQGSVLDVLEHPDQDRYPGQRIMVVQIANYAYLVPCQETAEAIVLKTIIPSRKATKQYLPYEDANEARRQ